MAVLPPKLCPSCGDEFVHSATRCGSCDVDLVGADTPLDPVRDQLPASDELVPLRAENAAWVDSLGARLAREEIPCRVEVLEGVYEKMARELHAVYLGRPQKDGEWAALADRCSRPATSRAASSGTACRDPRTTRTACLPRASRSRARRR